MMFGEKRITHIHNMNEIIEILKEMLLENYVFQDFHVIKEKNYKCINN